MARRAKEPRPKDVAVRADVGDGPKLTPVMRQYAEAKAAYPDAVIFFRLGEFYEMFHEDAVLASRVLGITLTSRNRERPDDEPMAGVPHHASHQYIAKLLAAGHKVALCEQLADPSKVKGIVPRAVVRVITPGLVLDETQLDARENHYLAAIDATVDALGTARVGLALLDHSTGELRACELDDGARLVAELVRAAPREVLLAPGTESFAGSLREALGAAAFRDEGPLTADARATLARHLGDDVARDAAVDHGTVALAAAARAVAFAAGCSPGQALPIGRVATLDTASTMHLDETAQTHLELVRALDGGKQGTLLACLDATVTAPGARLLRQRLLAPLADVGAIRRRLDEVEAFVTHARVRDELRSALRGLPDLERVAVKIALGDGTPRDLGLLRDGLVAIPRAAEALAAMPELERRVLLGDHAVDALDLVDELRDELALALVERPPTIAGDGGIVRDGYDAELDASRAIVRDATALVAALEEELRHDTGAASLRIRFTRVFGWYIEVTRSHLAKVPSAWRRKQTVAAGERYTNERLDRLAADIEHAEARGLEREAAIFELLVGSARSSERRVRALARRVSGWDVAAALADVAHRHDCVRPEVDDGDELAIEEGRHPVVEQLAAKGRFVPNDARLGRDAGRMWLITGPNMAGKSTFMRQVALIVVLAQMGAFVPAKRARVGLVDRLLSRVGASDNVARGESTFMVEMRETANILRRATRKSLVVLDEIGRGTSTYDGLAIAWAVAEHLHDVVGCRALFATHYHELTELARQAPHVVNMSVSAREHDDGVVFLHTVQPGPASRSYGVAVAKLAGLPEVVLARARARLAGLEADGSIGGRPARGRRAATDQLGLFTPSATDPETRLVLDTLRALDAERLTPLDAFQLVLKLKASLGGGG